MLGSATPPYSLISAGKKIPRLGCMTPNQKEEKLQRSDELPIAHHMLLGVPFSMFQMRLPVFYWQLKPPFVTCSSYRSLSPLPTTAVIHWADARLNKHLRSRFLPGLILPLIVSLVSLNGPGCHWQCATCLATCQVTHDIRRPRLRPDVMHLLGRYNVICTICWRNSVLITLRGVVSHLSS